MESEFCAVKREGEASLELSFFRTWRPRDYSETLEDLFFGILHRFRSRAILQVREWERLSFFRYTVNDLTDVW